MNSDDTANSSAPGSEINGSSSSRSDLDSVVIKFPGSSEERSHIDETSKSESPSSETSSSLEPASLEELNKWFSVDTRECQTCKKTLPLERFVQMRSKNSVFRIWQCNSCRIKRQRGTPAVLAKRKLIAERKQYPCADCGRHFPEVCMDFDHVRGEKVFNISQGVNWIAMDRFVAELDKCEVVCSNCHRIRTRDRKYPGAGRPLGPVAA